MRIALWLALTAAVAGCRETPTPPQPRPALPGPSSTGLPVHMSNLANGRAIFETRCMECHGSNGDGDGAAAPLLRTPPRDLSDVDYMAQQRPEYYAEAIRVGVPGTGMPRWDHVLDEDGVWDAAFYAWSLGAPEGAHERGRQAYTDGCAGCHAGDGMGVEGAPLGAGGLAAFSRAEVAEAIQKAHPDRAGRLSHAELADLAETLFGFLFLPTTGR